MRGQTLLRRLLDSRLVLGAAILLVCVSLSVRMKLDEWRRSRVRKSEGMREDDTTWFGSVS
jgi:hypothetical protein